ncbi:hypothetical protein [uncultured Abiotrophia sp.]|uniref:hypothetical protein n=1 Tax=uncultured Abiotrophia sp. TaxID=316094 RepID=UPI0028CFE6CA|nr:hypothetical protein [uncultured Abiotrophia sp.]
MIKKVESLLKRIDNLNEEDRRSLIKEVLAKYTINQTTITHRLSISIAQLNNAIRNGIITPIHEYRYEKSQAHKIFPITEYEDYAKRLFDYRESRKKVVNAVDVTQEELEKYRSSKKKYNPHIKN